LRFTAFLAVAEIEDIDHRHHVCLKPLSNLNSNIGVSTPTELTIYPLSKVDLIISLCVSWIDISAYPSALPLQIYSRLETTSESMSGDSSVDNIINSTNTSSFRNTH